MFIFGGRLLEERKRLGLNQDEMAKAGGVAKRTYCNYEAGDREPGAAFLEAIAAAGADVAYILTGCRSDLSPTYTAPAPAVEAGERLNRKEAALLDNYRHSPPSGQKALEAAARALAQSEGQGWVSEG